MRARRSCKQQSRPLDLDWFGCFGEKYQASALGPGLLHRLTWNDGTDEHEEETSLQALRFAIAPRSSSEEAELLRRALRESEEEANLQRAIQESLQHASETCEPLAESADLEPSKPERSGLLRQRSAPCIASEVADATARMTHVMVPLKAWCSPFALQGSTSPKALLWEQALLRASRAAEEFVVAKLERSKPSETAARMSSLTAPLAAEGSLQPYPTVPIRGSPPAPAEHLDVLRFATPSSNGYPACWEGFGDRSGRPCKQHLKTFVLRPSSEEYRAVTEYFRATVCTSGITVVELTRLQNPAVYKSFDGGPDTETIMFHGCKSESNERSIIANGFQVRHCVSGGQDFGTWFAYNAAYSNSGYVFMDRHAVRHLFVCVVSSKHVVLDSTIMRVVGQGCAYPLWLLKYTCGPPSCPTTPVGTASPATSKVHTASMPRVFHVVRDGAWVLE